jgi:hypothetical protein
MMPQIFALNGGRSFGKVGTTYLSVVDLEYASVVGPPRKILFNKKNLIPHQNNLLL